MTEKKADKKVVKKSAAKKQVTRKTKQPGPPPHERMQTAEGKRRSKLKAMGRPALPGETKKRK